MSSAKLIKSISKPTENGDKSVIDEIIKYNESPDSDKKCAKAREETAVIRLT